MIQQIEAEAIYHSIIICRTRSVEIGEKLPSAVFTKDGILTEEIQQEEGFDINYGFNAVKYQYGSKRIIVGQGAFLLSIISQTQRLLFTKSDYVFYDHFSCSKHMEFYLLSTKQSLIQIIPDVIYKQGAIFFNIIENQTHQNQKMQFKKIERMLNFRQNIGCKWHQNRPTFIFESQFAILSSPHFLNCFVQGKSPISHYVELGQQGFRHCIDSSIVSVIKQRYPNSKL